MTAAVLPLLRACPRCRAGDHRFCHARLLSSGAGLGVPCRCGCWVAGVLTVPGVRS